MGGEKGIWRVGWGQWELRTPGNENDKQNTCTHPFPLPPSLYFRHISSFPPNPPIFYYPVSFPAPLKSYRRQEAKKICFPFLFCSVLFGLTSSTGEPVRENRSQGGVGSKKGIDGMSFHARSSFLIWSFSGPLSPSPFF